MTLVIRRLGPGDERVGVEVGMAFHASRFDAPRVARFLADPDNFLVVAQRGNVLTGFFLAYRLQRVDRDASQLFIYDVEVLPGHRRQGIGLQLMEEARRIVARESMMEAFVLADRDNVAATELYRAAGGEEEGPGSRLFVFSGLAG